MTKDVDQRRFPHQRLTIGGVGLAIKTHLGNRAAIARAFGVSRQAVSKFISHHPELQQKLVDEVESLCDHAESQLELLVLGGDFKAIKYVLSTLGKNRGY